MNAVGPAESSGAVVAGVPSGLTDPAVRDLAWLLFSADLLCAQPPQAPLAEPWAHPGEARAVAQWLTELDRDPASLHDALGSAAPTRLGRYAEMLLAWFLQHGPAARLVAANVPLRHAGRTLGECDFLVETRDGRRLHWELAVKCYLHAGDGRARLADFVGPNLRDRFDRKRAHLLDHQLLLSAREEFASLGYPGPWLAQMFVKGWLFYRAGAGAQPEVSDPPELAPDHARGWWVTRSDWPAFAARQRADGWSELPRLAWLAPRRIAAGVGACVGAGDVDAGVVSTPASAASETGNAGSLYYASGEGPGDDATRGAPAEGKACARHHASLADRMAIAAPVDAATLLAHLPRPTEPTMVAAFASGGAGGYAEQSRGFIVPDDWPARAQAFARE